MHDMIYGLFVWFACSLNNFSGVEFFVFFIPSLRTRCTEVPCSLIPQPLVVVSYSEYSVCHENVLGCHLI